MKYRHKVANVSGPVCVEATTLSTRVRSFGKDELIPFEISPLKSRTQVRRGISLQRSATDEWP